MPLTDNAGLLTAWANDAHYEEVFAAQLDAVVRPDDLVIAVSASGNSRNVIAAMQVRNAGIDWADVLLGIMDGADPDSGTCWEVGYAYRKKPIVLVRTDLRRDAGSGAAGRRCGFWPARLACA